MWNQFLRCFLGVTIGLLLLTFAGLVILDPYDSLSFSPSFERGLMAKNQRMVYPTVARSQEFNSLIIGTSTIRMLKPEEMDGLFNVRFANLGMNDATAYEQVRLIQLFQEHHRNMKYLVLGVDFVWCNETAEVRRLTYRQFPERFFDANPWNDIFELLNLTAIKTAFRQIEYKLGVRLPKYQKDGYGHMSFAVSPDEYDLKKARRHIYGQETPKDLSGFHKLSSDGHSFDLERKTWVYGAHDMLFKLINELLEETQLILVFVPYHLYGQGEVNSRKRTVYLECKDRLKAQLKKRKKTTILDFMIPSYITMRDTNYTDAMHYNLDVGQKLTGLIGRGAKGQVAPHEEYEILLHQ